MAITTPTQFHALVDIGVDLNEIDHRILAAFVDKTTPLTKEQRDVIMEAHNAIAKASHALWEIGLTFGRSQPASTQATREKEPFRDDVQAR